MKLTKITFILLLTVMMQAFCFSSDTDWDIEVETYSAAEVEMTPQFKMMSAFDPEFHKTVFRLNKFPPSESYIFKVHRLFLKAPLAEYQAETGKHLDVQELLTEYEIGERELLNIQEALQEKSPCSYISSRGYLPGELVEFWVETKDGKSKSQKITFFPQPIYVKSDLGDFGLIAGLLNPTSYKLTLLGLEEGEEISCASGFFGESSELKVTYSKEVEIVATSNAQGKNLDSLNILITRGNGDELRIMLPFGRQLRSHLTHESPPVVASFASIKKVNHDQQTENAVSAGEIND